MTDTVSRCLNQMHDLLLMTSPHRGVDSANHVVDLSTFCLQSVSDSELAYCSSLLFNANKGIISFLQKTVGNNEFAESKTEILKFLKSYIQKLESNVNPYAVEIKDICVKLFSLEQTSKVKVETFPLLIQLLGMKLEKTVVDKLDVPKLVDKYFTACMQSSKQQSTVRYWIYAILGIFAEEFPEYMINYSDRLLSIYINILKSEMVTKKSKKPDMTVIAGCLRGLTSFLVNFTQSVEEGSKFSKDIYGFARRAVDPQVDLTRYEVPKAGLNLFAKHAGQLIGHMTNDYQALYDCFYRWCCHHNPDTKYAGIAAMDSFMKQVSEYITSQPQDTFDSKKIFKYFIMKFRSILDTNTSDTRQMAIGIKGYGFFAKPCKMFMKIDDVKFMFTEMMQRSEQIYLSQGELIEDRIHQLPNFLEALSFIIEELDEITDGFLVSLERLIIVLFEHFPKLSKGPRFLCYRSLVKLLLNLSAKGAVLKYFLSQIVYHGLIRTCSYPVLITEVGDESVEADALRRRQKVSYKDYLELWEYLLDKDKFKHLNLLATDLEKREAMHEMVYDEMIQAILKIVHKLDLTSTKDGQSDLQVEMTQEASTSNPSDGETDVVLSDPVAGLHPRVQKDFLVFINLVDFCKAVLPVHCTHSFERWIYVFGRDIIVLSTRFPVISGFYKLLQVTMKICKDIHFFKDIKMESQKTAEDMDIEIADNSDCANCFVLFRKFIQEVLVKMKQYKDDLLSSCLELVLSLPNEMVILDVSSIAPAVKLTLKLGLSYHPLAQAGIDALESWNATLPRDVWRPYFKDILPCFDGYLKSTESDNSSQEASKTITMATPSSSTRGRKIPIKLLKSSTTDKDSTGGPLIKIRSRILRLLGTLGGAVNLSLLGSDADIDSSRAVAWDTTNHLSFAVPFQDMKPTIYLDPFLPRIIELATTSSNRQTKVAACELLHSLVLYMLGKGVTQPDGGQKSPMEKLWKRIIPALLQLACDVERVAAQLFRPLVSQLIHWFTNNRKYESPETISLLDALLDGVIHPTDTALRDFTAQCLSEFLQWSIKQTTQKHLAKSPINIKSLLKRLYSLALHPSASKRLGAALAFNNIYKVFREESSLVDEFALEILVTYLDSLALSHTDDLAQGTQEQCKQVILHMERIIKVKAAFLNKDNKNRRIPRGFEKERSKTDEPGSVTLSHVIPWLIKHCGKPQTECRHQCMRLVCQLAPLLPGTSSAELWMKRTHEEYPSYFVHRFEGSGGGKNGLLTYPTLSDMGGTFSLRETLIWYDFLLASLDCYSWAFGERLLSPGDVFVESAPEVKYKSVLFNSLRHFLSNLAMFGIQAAANFFKSTSSSKGTEDVFSPKEIDEYNRAKCTVIVRTMNFVTILLQGYAKDSLQVVPPDFWNESLFNTILSCLLEPGALGFNVGDVDVIENLPDQTRAVCVALVRSLPHSHLSLFKDCLVKRLSLGSRCNLLEQLPIPLAGCGETRIDHLHLIHLVSGYQQLHATGLLMEALQAQGSLSVETCGSRILNSVYEGVRPAVSGNTNLVMLTPASHQLASKLLELAIDLGIQHEALEVCIIKSTSAADREFGEAFYRAFQSALNGYFIKTDSNLNKLISLSVDHPKLVCSMLNAILDQVYRETSLRTRYGTSIALAVLRSWNTMHTLWTSTQSVDLKHSLLELLKKILILDSKFLTETGNPSTSSVFSMYSSLLTDKTLTLAFKSRALELLPYFTRMPQEQLSNLKSDLDVLVADNFPLRSTEFIPGSPRYNDYITALDKLLAALVSSGSDLLLRILSSIMCREDVHVHEEHIQASLVAFVKRLGPTHSQAKQAVDLCYEIFTSEMEHRNDTRRAAVLRMCVPLLTNTSKKTLNEFYSFHIKSIMGILEAKSLRVSDPSYENQLVSKLGCFKLIEVLYTRLNKTELNTPQSLINKAYCDQPKTGKELTMAITKCAHSVKSEDMRGETVLLDLRRQLHCYAYNALVALISCTQVEQKFYLGFLFSENPIKGQFLFDNLIDCLKKYEFETVLSAPVARKKQMTSIRTEARSRDREEGSLNGSPGYTTGRSVRYLSSQYLADSSLSEEVSQFDFSTPIQAFAATDVTDAPPSDVDQNTEEDYFESVEDTVEMDELNQHECMAKLCGLLKHLNKNKIGGESEKEMPGWMNALLKKFSSSETHINIQLFLAKLVVNEAKIFEPYAKSWLTPLMELVLKMFQDEGPSGKGLNYFVVDVLVTMLFWSIKAIPEDKYLASKLVEAVMARTHHENRSVFKNNLEIVKTMVEVWKTKIEVPTKVIFDHFSGSDPNKKDNVTGIQLLGVVLANGLSPFARGCSVNQNSFYTKLVNNLSFKYKDVHAASAEVIGMVLKQLTSESAISDSSLPDMVISKLLSLLSSTAQDTSKFITCVHKLQINYPPIMDKFINRILFILPTVHGILKTLCLEIILSRASNTQDLMLQLKNKGLTEMLSHRDEATQVALLKIIHTLLEKLTMRDIEYVTPSITAMSTNPSTVCRDIMYDILIWIYDTYRSDSSFSEEEGSEAILATTKDYLLRGLIDENKELRLKLQNFWSDETRLPSTTLERLVDVLRAMYSPNTESQYLSYTTNLILHLTSLSPDFNRLMFEQPLSECKFEDYPIDYSWQQRHLTMTPLFAATQGSTLASGMSQSQGGSSSMEVGFVRATQTNDFTPTQEPGRSQAFDWLNPSSQGESQSLRQPFTVGTSETQSSLLFATKSDTNRRRKPVPHDFGSQRLGSSQASTSQVDGTQDSNEQQEILRLKRRFLKDDTATRNYFAKREAMRKKMREQVKNRQQASRDSHVVMYRKYRAGDLPDIQIKHCELIAPLQAVAQCDSTIAKHLFSSLFQAIFTEAEREGEACLSDLQSALNNMVATSTQYFPAFVSSIQSICFNVSKLTIDPSSVSTASLASLQQPMGVMLLEKQLLQNTEEEPKRRKRARVEAAPPSETTATWLELAKLYRSIGEYDVLQGIFSSHIGTQDLTPKALEAEARGDYAQALKLYNQAISCEEWPNGEPQQEEEDLWHDARLQCFDHLTQWDNLDKFSELNIDDADPPDLDKVWSDTFYQENYLPFLIRSKLKLYCRGHESTVFIQFLNRAVQVDERKAFLEEFTFYFRESFTSCFTMEKTHAEVVVGKDRDKSRWQVYQKEDEMEALKIVLQKSKSVQYQGSDTDDDSLESMTPGFGFRDKNNPKRSRHSDDLALLHILQGDYDRARYYVANCIQGFLMDWTALDSMMLASRSSKLQSLQKITEMQEFLDFIANEDNFSDNQAINQLFSKWSSRYPDQKLHPISVWDDIITNRCVFMNKMLERFAHVSSTSSRSQPMDVDDTEEESPGYRRTKVKESMKLRFLREKVLLQLKMADTAKEQANFPVANRLLREAFQVINEDLKNNNESLQLQWTHAYAAMHHKKSHGLTAVESIDAALSTIGQLEKFSDSQELRRRRTTALRHHILKAHSFDIMRNALEEGGFSVLSSLDDSKKRSLASICGSTDVNSPEKVVSQLMIRSFTSLQNAIKSAKSIEELQNSGDSSNAMIEGMMAMVKFCDAALRKKEDDEKNAPEIDIKLFPGIVVRYVLKAMTYCSEEARQRFPRLLQLVELYPDTLDAFIKKASVVPCWIFIGWINQMVALLDKKEGRAVHGILNEIATNYPQALCYPFKISSEQFVFDSSETGKTNKEAVDRLHALLEMPLLDDFIASLEQMQNPDLAYKDWENKMKLLIEDKNTAAIEDCYFHLLKTLFGDDKTAREKRTKKAAQLIGTYRKKIANKYAADVKKAFGQDGNKLKTMSSKDFCGKSKAVLDLMKKGLRPDSEPRNLKEYSPWLWSFQSSNYARKLEIPGQYTGRGKPLTEYHTKIASFDERVLVMSSMRKPKRLTIRGDDEKDYMFLVKGGEDLRLDQRIEQLFCLMNDILTADPACKQRNLRLRTYQVVPMTPRVGLIEWVTNTKPLKDFILRAMTPAENKQKVIEKARELHERWLGKYSKEDMNLNSKYGEMFSKANRTEVQTDFHKKQAFVPWDLLRRAFEQLSASPEAYLMLRSHFARTHACLCICQYLIGIGDRHLSNFMVDTETGGMVGIDFGHAFGSATQFLPVPELMPFRLTRQIVNFLLPLKESGLLRSTMIHTLRALRQNNELLLSTMDVFVKEPLLDWKVHARNQAKIQGTKPEDEEDVHWYPREKVETARKKLHGANPAYITRNDIRLSFHKHKKWIHEMESVCIGERKVNIRAEKPESGLPVEDQVDCLIDQATDANILGRTYSGWEPWM